MATDKSSLLHLLIDFYLVFSKLSALTQGLLVTIFLSSECSTLVIQSSGAVAELYGNLLGVYRVVGDNMYKQEGGENYIYYR